MIHPSNKIMESLWTFKELGEFLKVNESVVRYWMRTKALPHIRLGKHTRFDQADIKKWLIVHKSVSFCCDGNGELKRIS